VVVRSGADQVVLFEEGVQFCLPPLDRQGRPRQVITRHGEVVLRAVDLDPLRLALVVASSLQAGPDEDAQAAAAGCYLGVTVEPLHLAPTLLCQLTRHRVAHAVDVDAHQRRRLGRLSHYQADAVHRLRLVRG
jgi:hypothetical protein